MERPLPTCSRIALEELLDDVEHGPGRPQPASSRKRASIRVPVLGVHDLGVELDAEQAVPGVLHRGHRGGLLGPRGHGEAGRGLGGGIPVRHPHPLVARRPGEEGAVVGRSAVAPYSAAPVGWTVPPRLATISWKP